MAQYLPVELLFEILVRLPVKSIARFRSVSSSWRSLIDHHPAFVNRHLALSQYDFGRKRMVTGNGYRDSFGKSYSLSCLNNNMELDVVSHPDAPRPPRPRDPVYVVGSDNGIVCVLHSGEVYLWNPSTRQTKKLPPREEEHGETYPWTWTYGFGYASLADDYKFVCIKHSEDVTATDNDPHQVWVYSLKTASWRQIVQEADNFPVPKSFCLSAELLNGALHWILSTKTDSCIVSFDLCTETYRKIPIYYRHNPAHLTFGVWRGCLCVLVPVNDDDDKSERQFWVMKEYGVAESWHHCATISPPSHVGVDDPQSCRRVGKIVNSYSEKDEILIQCGPLNFTWYSTRNKTCRHTPLQGRTSYNISARVYVESLVSLT